MEMGWRWDFTYEILPQMAIATLNTILAAGVGYAIASVSYTHLTLPTKRIV